ncbi:MAG: phosphatidylglycerophosphatase A [Nitrospirae bacterium]|nr:phosphatidylglycerophosphatase A [Nitrospirota bacterium]
MNTLYISFARFISTLFFIGYIPFAPGTFGSLAGLAFVWSLNPTTTWQIILLITGFFIGVIASHVDEKSSGQKDSGHIVIDEFVGYIAAVIFLPLTPVYLISAFILFRFFDIFKPPPIRNIEKRLGGGIGIMLDDLLAGIFTNLALQIVRLLIA